MIALLALLAACYLPPVPVPIAEPFVAPACRYCPGHRGVEYDLAPGTRVGAAAAGEVTFSGVVAGIRYLVVLHTDGIRATYGSLQNSAVGSGDSVTAGDVVAISTDRLYFGLRSPDGTPLDPADYLAVVTRRARLVPIDGSRSRPAASRAPTCPNGAGTAGSPR